MRNSTTLSHPNPASPFEAIHSDSDCPPFLAREYLESLGYQIGDPVFWNAAERLQVHTVERIENGTVCDFSWCANLEGTYGMILPYPVEYYLELLPENQ